MFSLISYSNDHLSFPIQSSHSVLDLFIYPLIYSLLSQQSQEKRCYQGNAGLQISYVYARVCVYFKVYMHSGVCGCGWVGVCQRVFSCSSCFMSHCHSLRNAYVSQSVAAALH